MVLVATWTWARITKTVLTSSDLAVFPSAPSRPECSQWRLECVYRRPRDRTSRSFSPSPAWPPMTEYRCHRPIAWSLPTDRRARRRGSRRSLKAMSIAPRADARVAVRIDAHLNSWSFSSSTAAWLLVLGRTVTDGGGIDYRTRPCLGIVYYPSIINCRVRYLTRTIANG